jgi:hypothetical protein
MANRNPTLLHPDPSQALRDQANHEAFVADLHEIVDLKAGFQQIIHGRKTGHAAPAATLAQTRDTARGPAATPADSPTQKRPPAEDPQDILR